MSETKTRPIRLYYDKKSRKYFFYKGKKRIPVNVNGTNLPEAQRRAMTKLKGTMHPNAIIKRTERAILGNFPIIGARGIPTREINTEVKKVVDIGKEEQLKRKSESDQLKELRKKKKEREEQFTQEDLIREDELAKKLSEEKTKQIADEAKRTALEAKRLADLEQEKKDKEQKIKGPLYEDKSEEPVIPPIPDQKYIEKPGTRISQASKRMGDRNVRHNNFFTAVKPYHITSDIFPAFDLWNGINNSGKAIMDQLLNIIKKLYKKTEDELRYIASDPKFVIKDYDTKLRIFKKIVYQLSPTVYKELLDTGKLDPSEFSPIVDVNKIPIINVQQLGFGSKLPALYNDQIDDYFADEQKYPNFGGVIASDEIDQLPKKLPIGFIMNLDRSDQPGSHWVAVYINGDSLEYFDPLAEPPSPQFVRDIRSYLTSMKVPVLLKFKINKIKQQHGNSYKCGYHAIRFLDDRFNGIPFPLSTRYTANGKIENNTKEGEAAVNEQFKFI